MIYWIWTWKILGLPYWTRNDFIYWNWPWKILELSYWILIVFICVWYIGLGLEKHSALGLPHQPTRDIVTKVWKLSWINCFPPFYIVLIYPAFTAPLVDNLCMMISPPTLLCFLCSSAFCMSFSHMSITHLECFPIL